MSHPLRGRILRLVLTLAGLAVLAVLIDRVGIAAIWTHIRRFGPWFLFTVPLGAVWMLVQSLAWNRVQAVFHPGLSTGWLWRVKVTAEALNTLLPTANLGGDALRAWLIRHRVSLSKALPGVLVDKTFEFAAGMIFMATGLITAVLFYPLPRSLLAPALICLGLACLGIMLLVAFQVLGIWRVLIRLFGWFPTARRLLERRRDRIRQLDADLLRFYRSGAVRISTVLALHFLARLLGAVEMLVILRALGLSVGFAAALFVTAMVTVANTIFFVFPGQWGVYEGAGVLVLGLLGAGAEMGLGMGLIRRIRRLVFVLLGLIFFALDRRPRLEADPGVT
ncbi:MAG: flippase-like domain-containing protein [Candidatus Aminicenantes bacterium]|nr:flippase-like domain-containing protein [Candidatus Aminicenantes bacterium]